MSNDIIMQPVEAFTSMFHTHLENADGNLVINNFILFRNVLKQAAKDSYLDESEVNRFRSIEELWASLNKGCSCTKNERMKKVAEATAQFALSEEGRAMLLKVKEAYSMTSLAVDIPEPNIKCNI